METIVFRHGIVIQFEPRESAVGEHRFSCRIPEYVQEQLPANIDFDDCSEAEFAKVVRLISILFIA